MFQTLKNARTITLISVSAALCLAIQLTPRPPNVEFTSLFTFVMGFLFGSFTGVFFGSFVMFTNGFFSPWGLAGLNMPFQIVGMSIVGLAGGLYRKYLRDCSQARLCAEVAVSGAFLTLLYDIITNTGVAVSSMLVGIDPNLALIMAIAYGAPFSVIHTFSNIVVFGVIFSPLVKALNNILGGEKFWWIKERSCLQ